MSRAVIVAADSDMLAQFWVDERDAFAWIAFENGPTFPLHDHCAAVHRQPKPFTHRVPVPSIVTATFWVMVSGAALNVVALAAQILQSESLLPMSLTVAIASLARVILAIYFHHGYHQVRTYITLTTIVSLAMVGTIVLVGRADVLAYLYIALGVSIIVLAWLPATSRYFHEVATARRAYESRQLDRQIPIVLNLGSFEPADARIVGIKEIT